MQTKLINQNETDRFDGLVFYVNESQDTAISFDEKAAFKPFAANFNLKKKREFLGLTQRQLAVAVGVTVTTVYRWETTENIPRHQRIVINHLERKILGFVSWQI